MEDTGIGEKDFFACCGSTQFAREMAAVAPFTDLAQAVAAARNIWFNTIDVNGWLEAFAAHPQIGKTPSAAHKSPTSAQWSQGEQSTALATATDSTLQELHKWNSLYRQKFGFIFLICASGRSTPEILAELKRRYTNRPIVEFEIAAREQMKITELRLSKLFSVTANAIPTESHQSTQDMVTKVEGIEVNLEMWETNEPYPPFGDKGADKNWILKGSSITDKDGWSGQLMKIADDLRPGFYRISFNTGKYNPDGLYPFISVVFEVRESHKREHFHVPLLLSPFSFSTYRGS